MSQEVQELRSRLQEEEEAVGCIVCVSHTPATVWPGFPMIPRYLSQREARLERKRGGQTCAHDSVCHAGV